MAVIAGLIACNGTDNSKVEAAEARAKAAEAQVLALTAEAETSPAAVPSAPPTTAPKKWHTWQIRPIKIRDDSTGTGRFKTIKVVIEITQVDVSIGDPFPCVRLYDQDGALLAKATGDTPGPLGKAYVQTIAFQALRAKLWSDTATMRVYMGPFGCSSTPHEALSEVLELSSKDIAAILMK